MGRTAYDHYATRQKKGPWTPEEDLLLIKYIQAHGEGQGRTLPHKAGLQRCGKGCRLRWVNYLRPNVKRGNISLEEEDLIIRLHKLLGNRWSLIAGRVPGRTDNEIKKYWNTHLSKKFRCNAIHYKAASSLSELKQIKPLQPFNGQLGQQGFLVENQRSENLYSYAGDLINSKASINGNSALANYGMYSVDIREGDLVNNKSHFNVGSITSDQIDCTSYIARAFESLTHPHAINASNTGPSQYQSNIDCANATDQCTQLLSTVSHDVGRHSVLGETEPSLQKQGGGGLLCGENGNVFHLRQNMEYPLSVSPPPPPPSFGGSIDQHASYNHDMQDPSDQLTLYDELVSTLLDDSTVIDFGGDIESMKSILGWDNILGN